MSKRVKVNVGTLDEMGQRFVSAWHRLERGEKVRERHLTFPDLAAMLNALSPKRLELLRAVHEHPARSVKALREELPPATSIRLGLEETWFRTDVLRHSLLSRENQSLKGPPDAGLCKINAANGKLVRLASLTLALLCVPQFPYRRHPDRFERLRALEKALLPPP